MTPEQIQARKEKAMAIFDSITATAATITESVKQFPVTHKRRNVFIKTYKRRPFNKIKLAHGLSKIGFATYSGAISIATIAAQPIPKFPPVGQSNASGSGIAYVNGPDSHGDIITRDSFKVDRTPKMVQLQHPVTLGIDFAKDDNLQAVIAMDKDGNISEIK